MVTMPVESGFFVTSGFGPRGGGFHWGTDFGRAGGSGGYPVFAMKAGRVANAGPASGFGQWVCVDHPGSVGGGFTVYGHVIPEVSVGDRVEEGQRIARINPDRKTNGGVAPHLHAEWHRRVWSRPGPDRLDPMTMLAGAKWPDQPAVAPAADSGGGPIFGIDISSWQKDYPLRDARADGMRFVIIRLCDGTYADPLFRSHLEDAERNGFLVSCYWYLRAPSEGTSIAQQVDVIDRQLAGRKDLGVWIDAESVGDNGEKLLRGADVWEAKRELEKRGYYVPGIYSGAWYWEHMPGGEPSMDGLGYLWVSNYGRNRKGRAQDLYAAEGGDGHRGWSYPLGDRTPDLLQFGSNGVVGGRHPIDVNAFRGSLAELTEIFNPAGAPPIKEDVVANADISAVVTQAHEAVTAPIASAVNPAKAFTPRAYLKLIDAATWEMRVLLQAVAEKVGLDPERVVADAKAADRGEV